MMRGGALLLRGMVALAVGAGCDAPFRAREREEPPAETAKPEAVKSEAVKSAVVARRESARSEGSKVVTPAIAAPAAVGAGDGPEWERMLREADRLRSGGPGQYGAAVMKEKAAFAAIRALPADDPRFVEAQCLLAQREHVGADVEAALLAGIARLRAHPPADNYAYLDRVDLISIVLGSGIDDDGTVQIAPGTTITSAGDCSRADVASLTGLLIDSYHSYGMFKRAYEGVTPPAVPDAFRAASQTLIDLHAELVKAEGAKSPRAAALIERYAWACHWSQRKKFKKICVADDEAYEQALPVRLAALGEEHPLTRASLLRVAAQRLSEAGGRKEEEARQLLERAAKGEIVSAPQATAAVLLALFLFRDGKVDEALALFAEVEAVGEQVLGDDKWTYGHVLQIYSDALKAVRRYPEALRVFKKHLALQGPLPADARVVFPGYAELLAAAGERAAAIEEYGRRVDYAVWLEETGGNQPARQMGRDQRLAALRGRAAVRRAIGDASGAEADLAEAKTIEAGPPVTPD